MLNPIQNSINQSKNLFELENRSMMDIMKILRQEEEKHFENILRTEVKPVIKGEITKGKLKWRGITLGDFSTYKFGVTTRQLLQRGIPVGKAFSFVLNI